MEIMRQAELIRRACCDAGLKGRIKWIEGKFKANSFSEKLAFRLVRKPIPVKVKYTLGNSLEMCFFFDDNGVPSFSFSGYAKHGENDTETLFEAFSEAAYILQLMQKAKEEELNESDKS